MWGERVGDTRPREIGGTVVATLLRFLATSALPAAECVDEVRMAGANGLGIHAELFTNPWQEAGDEDVGVLEQVVQHGAALRVGEIDSDAALSAVWLLDEIVRAADIAGDKAGADQTALRVAVLGVFDLDDVGTPVGQHRARRRYERPRRRLDHRDASQRKRRAVCH